MKSYIEFKVLEQKTKTAVYEVKSIHRNISLGVIKWYCPWRQYCFFPISDTIWNIGCLNEIINFIKELKKLRAAGPDN